jgi:PAP2 superfamily protein
MNIIEGLGQLFTRTFLAFILMLGATVSAAAADRVSSWNVTAATASAMAGQNAVVSSRTLAIVQSAVHDALNAIDRRFEPYAFDDGIDPLASPDAAVATAAHDALVGIIPVGALPFVGFGSVAQQGAAIAFVNATYATDLASIPDGNTKTRGIAVGHAAANALLALRVLDGATTFVPYAPGTNPGDWQPTPNPVPFDPPAPGDRLPAVLPGWGDILTFVLRTSDQFQTDGPPALTSDQYAGDYNEVKSIGSKVSSVRTGDQTQIARFWYEGSPIGWSRIARVVADARGLDLWERARLLALVNLAMADGFIAGWKDKYTYNFWRPVTAIRAGDTDGNDFTIADPAWDSLLNSPALPDYPSTHSILGGAASEVLRRFFHHDDIAFTSTSGAPFAGITRSFSSFSEAAEENGNSRIYAGIHFRSAVTDGIAQGKRIGQFVFTHALKPVDDSDGRH